MTDKKSNRGLVLGLIAALLGAISIIFLMAKVIRDFSAKLNTTEGDDYIPDWSDEDSFDVDLNENLAAPDSDE